VALPGHPAGDPLDSVEGCAAWLADALDQVPAPRALVGHSLGAAIALTLCRERPELVHGLVLIGIGPRLPVADGALARARDDFAAESARLAGASLATEDPRTLQRILEVVVAAGSASLVADYTACRDFDAGPWLGEVRAPALVIAGARDRITPVDGAEVVARALPSALMAVVPEAGHLAMVEQPGAVNLLLAGYLGRLELTLDDGD
jgi:pimeloyl-ACP methyl ester carboxylesterase